MKKIRNLLIVLFTIFSLSFIGFSGYKIYQWWAWKTPSYCSKFDKVLCSPDIHRLTDQQENTFTNIAWKVIKTEDKNIKRSDFKNYSLYVEKDKTPKTYDIVYDCKAGNDVKIEATITLKINEPTLKGNPKFTVKNTTVEQIKKGLVEEISN